MKVLDAIKQLDAKGITHLTQLVADKPEEYPHTLIEYGLDDYTLSIAEAIRYPLTIDELVILENYFEKLLPDTNNPLFARQVELDIARC